MTSKVVFYKGARGKGKTLTMVKDGSKYFKNGWRILRNFNCRFGEYIKEEEILNLSKDSELYNCVIMIDEIQVFFDARQSLRKNHINFSNFIQQLRKRNIILLATSQYSNTVDLRFRQHVDIIAYPKYIKEIQVCVVTYIDVTMIEDATLQKIELPSVTIVFNARKVFPLYDTTEMIR